MNRDPLDEALREPAAAAPFSDLVRDTLAEAATAARDILNDADPDSPTEIVMLTLNGGQVMLSSSLEHDGTVEVLRAAFQSAAAAAH